MEPTIDLINIPERDAHSRSIAHAWQQAIAGTALLPFPADEINDRLARLANEALQLLLANDEPTAGVVAERSRRIGQELVELNLVKPYSLERSLEVLGRELSAGATGDPGTQARLSAILAGIAGGFTAEAQKVLLVQQEEINLAKTMALQQARQALADSLEVLAERNRQLSAEITERLRVEQNLREHANRLENIHATHLAILSAESLEDILDLSIRLIHNTNSPLITSVMTYDLTAGIAEVLQSSWPDRYPPGTQLTITLWDMIAKLRAGDVYYIEDAPAIPAPNEGLQMIAAVGGHSFLAVPLLYRDELIGAITIVLGSIQTFSPDELAIIREIADSAAVAVQHRYALEAEQQARMREVTLREVAAGITGGLELEAVLETILDQLERVLPTTSSSIMLLEGDELIIKTTRKVQTDKRLLDDMIRHAPNNLMAIIRTGRLEIIADTRRHPAWITLPGGEGIRCWMGVPLIVKGASIGILTLDRSEPHAFTPEDEDLALAFANQAAIAIENARLFQTVQQHAEELEMRVRGRTRELQALYGISAAAAGNSEIDDVLRQALQQALLAFDCPAGCIYLDGGDSPADPPVRLAMGDESLVQAMQRIPVETLLAVRAALFDTPLIIADPAQLEENLKDTVQAYAAAPLRAHGKVLGLIGLLGPRWDHFSAEARPLLTTIADQIASAVENIRLRQKAREAAILAERDRLARDLHDAVTQSLYSLSLFAEAAQEAARANDAAKTQRHLASVLKMAQQALGELRLMLFELRSETAARTGLVEALRYRLKTVEERIGIAVEFKADSIGHLPVVVEEALYRVALEALNNALRHGPAPHVEVRLFLKDGQLVLIVADDGAGFDVAEATRSGGMGLNSMTKRIEQAGGTLVVDSTPGEGTRIEARAPLMAGGPAGKTAREGNYG